jgi:hypothetical protein
MQSTNFSTIECIVIQICPQELAGETTVNGKKFKRTAAFVFLPNSKPGTTISCPLNYFQESCSITQKWIKSDSGQRIKLESLDQLSKVIITKKVDGIESEIYLPEFFSKKLFDYFALDINNNLVAYKGFDCYALQSLLSDVKMYPPNPTWDYKDISPSLGDIIVLSTDKNIPDSIKHWALSLGEDLYLSKFGRSGEGADSQVTIMNLEGMTLLYECKCCYVVTPIENAEIWDGYKYWNA